jgi:phage tail sheath protein FI
MFDLLVLPGVIDQYHTPVTSLAQSTAEERTDCVYIRDLTGVNSTIATAISTAAGIDSNYSAAYYPWVKVKDLGTNKDIMVPPSVLVPQAYAYSDKIAAEWFAPAGLNRGGLGGAIDTKIRLSKADRDALYKNRINPIAKFPNGGIVIWGQKTLQVRDTALNRINVRRLLINLRRFVGDTAKNYVFENNTTATRNKLVNAIVPYMENVQLKQGLYAFRVQIDDTLNTSDVIDRNQLIGKIYISPAKGIEFILLEFNIQPSGATFE